MHTCGFIDAGVPGGHAMNPVVKYFHAIISSSWDWGTTRAWKTE
jgi:hypothetical protein